VPLLCWICYHRKYVACLFSTSFDAVVPRCMVCALWQGARADIACKRRCPLQVACCSVTKTYMRPQSRGVCRACLGRNTCCSAASVETRGPGWRTTLYGCTWHARSLRMHAMACAPPTWQDHTDAFAALMSAGWLATVPVDANVSRPMLCDDTMAASAAAVAAPRAWTT
jgi:hypothetical protein